MGKQKINLDQIDTTGSAWALFSPTAAVGWAGTPTTTGTAWMQIGKIVFYAIFVSGTSNSTDTRIQLPVACKNRSSLNVETASGLSVNNGVMDAYPARVYLDPATDANLVFAVRNGGTASWTASGTKTLRALLIYEAA